MQTKNDKPSKYLALTAFALFSLSGMFYLAFPPKTTSAFLDSSFPAMAWGAIFTLGGSFAIWGIIAKTPHIERFGLMLVVVAGADLALTQTFVMLGPPVVWTRGGGVFAYWAFTLLSLAMWFRLRERINAVNLAADLENQRQEGREDGA